MENTTDFKYSRAEKLKSKKLFELLFTEGKSISSFPLRLIYVQTDLKDGVQVKAGVSVSKRKFKNATQRNRIKRVLREAYRLNKSIVLNNSTSKYALLILYLGKEMPVSADVNAATVLLLEKFIKKIGNSDTAL
ncbi:ribonuclease P protein component [Cellulophaga sp. HaHaR_3_176]|uniref:ribonuclease P protein component n=1 Tax=Cellulophaga sp. HaHaR_3_176 TaxID=1942464 RepID=UPI001C1F76BC|nr:ribonuclease P protein component [Cellulophaga sp. HaHaR_3_176]QWX83600.1 ribonuclease P protein component [Cellulophaga sp. HaHaR_3_176]